MRKERRDMLVALRAAERVDSCSGAGILTGVTRDGDG